MAPKGIVIQISGDGASAAKALELVDQHLRETAVEAKHSASEISEAMEAVKGAMETLGLAVGIGEAIAKIREMISASIELGVEIGHLSKQTGMSAETLSTLKFMSEQTGVSFEAMTKGFKKFSTEMLGAEEGKKASIQTFARLNISQADVTKHANDMIGMLEIVADRFQTLPDGPQKAAEAVALFGKAGMTLIPILDQGSAGIAKMQAEAESLGLVLDEHAIAKLEEMHKTEMLVEASTQGLALAITSALGPALMGAEELMGKAIVKLRELLNLENQNAGAGSGVALPAKLAGLQGAALDAERIKAAQARDAAKTKLDALEEAHEKEGGSIAAFNKKKLDLEKEYFDQEKTMYAAMYVDQKDTVNRAQEQLADAQKNHSVVLSSLAGDKTLDDAKKKVAEAKSLLGDLGAKMADADGKLSDAGKSNKGLTLQDQTGGHAKATNGITEAAGALDQANTAARMETLKAADQLELAQMEASHKLFLTSDEDFYRDKLAIQKLELNQEEEALRANLATKQGTLKTQNADPKLNRGKSGSSAEELKTQKEILDIQTKIAATEEKKAALDIGAKLAEQERADALHLADLKIAAQLEEHTNSGIQARLALMEREQQIAMAKTKSQGGDTKPLEALQKQEQELLKITDLERNLSGLKAAARIEENNNSGITARLALMQREQDIAMKKTTADGGDTRTLALLQQQEQELLRINEIEREINQTKAEGAVSVGVQKDREEKDPSQRKAATKEINALNKETAATLKDLTAQYDALAATLGGEFVEKAKAMHAQLGELNNPNQKQENKPYDDLGKGITSMGESIGKASVSGKDSFHKMAVSMEQDLIQLAVKFAAQKWLTPFLNGLFPGGGSGSGGGGGDSGLGYDDGGGGGGGVGSFADGGDYSGDAPIITSENGPELMFPKGPGTIMPDPELFFPKDAAPTMPSGALSDMMRVPTNGPPNVTMNITNASSQPVTARQTGTSFDAQMKSFVIQTILEDQASGGPISAANQSG
jgi:hypothetical protein